MRPARVFDHALVADAPIDASAPTKALYVSVAGLHIPDRFARTLPEVQLLSGHPGADQHYADIWAPLLIEY